MDQTRFTLRIHPLIMKKLKVIADHNGRSVNKEIEQILKWTISKINAVKYVLKNWI